MNLLSYYHLTLREMMRGQASKSSTIAAFLALVSSGVALEKSRIVIELE